MLIVEGELEMVQLRTRGIELRLQCCPVPVWFGWISKRHHTQIVAMLTSNIKLRFTLSVIVSLCALI